MFVHLEVGEGEKITYLGQAWPGKATSERGETEKERRKKTGGRIDQEVEKGEGKKNRKERRRRKQSVEQRQKNKQRSIQDNKVIHPYTQVDINIVHC